jgi:hypothetical protein
MWAVTTQGDLPDEHEQLEIHGYRRDGPETVEYGRSWVHELRRDAERINVRIEHADDLGQARR